jgi:UDP-GlcNAc:undecaprenyl-phosphate GlcNAc-1-phosphate transferase
MDLVLALAAAGATCGLASGLVRLAPALGLVDRPGEGKIHRRPVPTAGGLAIVAVFLAALWTAHALGRLELGATRLWGLTGATLLVTALGLVDDLRGSSAWTKLLVQAVAGLVVYLHGFGIERLTNPWGPAVALGLLAAPATLAWLMVVSNAINVIDGLDGLAAGAVAIGTSTLFLIAVRLGEAAILVPALLLAAVTLGFLPLNLPPARLFLGDTGALTLGFLVGTISLLENRKGTVAVTLLLPIVLLGLPLLDAMLAVIRRLRTGRHPFQRDTRHLHHRLLRLGLRPGQVLTLVYGVCLYLGVTAYLMAQAPKEHVVILGTLLALGVALALKALQYVERRQREAR